MTYFSRKKVFVSFFLSLFIVFRHTTTFPLYGELPYGINLLYVFLRWGITPAAVPLFLILSGVLFYRDYTPDRYTEKLRRRVYSLLIPYLCWNAINMLIEAAETMLLGQFFVGHERIVLTPMNILMGVVHHQYNSSFWTIYSLFAFAVFAPLFDRLLRNRYIGLVSIAAAAVLAHYDFAPLEILFSSRTGVVYYLVGAYIGRFGWNRFVSVSGKAERYFCTAVVIASAGICTWLSLHAIELPVIVSEIVLIAAALCLWVSADWIVLQMKKPCPVMMTHSFFLYALHTNLCKVFARVIYYIFPKHWAMAPINFVLTNAVMIVFVEVFCFLLKKYCKPQYELLSGGRAQ